MVVAATVAAAAVVVAVDNYVVLLLLILIMLMRMLVDKKTKWSCLQVVARVVAILFRSLLVVAVVVVIPMFHINIVRVQDKGSEFRVIILVISCNWPIDNDGSGLDYSNIPILTYRYHPPVETI